MMHRRLLLSLAAAGTLALAGCERAAPPHHFNAVDLTGAQYAHGFDLPDVDGKPRTLADFKGKVTVVFFGYTQCPDACPTTMAELAGIAKALGADAAKLQVVFITVDPARDSAALLKSYVTNFRPDFVALRGDDAQTRAVAKEFKVFYQKVGGKSAGSYSMDHSAASFVFDPSGRVRLFVPYGGDPKVLAADIKTLAAS